MAALVLARPQWSISISKTRDRPMVPSTISFRAKRHVVLSISGRSFRERRMASGFRNAVVSTGTSIRERKMIPLAAGHNAESSDNDPEKKHEHNAESSDNDPEKKHEKHENEEISWEQVWKILKWVWANLSNIQIVCALVMYLRSIRNSIMNNLQPFPNRFGVAISTFKNVTPMICFAIFMRDLVPLIWKKKQLDVPSEQKLLDVPSEEKVPKPSPTIQQEREQGLGRKKAAKLYRELADVFESDNF